MRGEASGKTPTKRGAAAAKRRLARITRLLEGEFGKPRWYGDRDLVGSLVATVLSQNTSDTNSARAYAGLRERFADWETVSRASEASIASAIRRGGLANIKARRIRRILRSIGDGTGGLDLEFLRGMPDEEVLSYLLKFDGVGSKTAACVALFGLGRDVMPVDTHVHRVMNRLGVVGETRTPDATFDALRGLVPVGKALSLHVNLIRLGRSLCRPREPACGGCPLLSVCAFASGDRPGDR